MMKVDEFLAKAHQALELPSKYQTGGWGKWDGSKWGWDCVCLIKGILWGWKADTSKPRGGGAVYASNGVPDIGTEEIIKVCNNISTNFNNLTAGEMVWMSGHVGIYIGGGNVIEASVGWNNNKVFVSQIDSKGNRTFNGVGGSAPWKKHGFLPYVDYTKPEPKPEPQPEPKPEPVVETIKVGDAVVPTRLVNYTGTHLKQYDDIYYVTELNGDRAVCCALRNGKYVVWAAMNVKDLEKI